MSVTLLCQGYNAHYSLACLLRYEGALMRRRAGGRRCGACGRGTKRTPRTREARGLRPGGITTPPRGASLDWDCALWVSGAVCEARQA